MPRKAFVMAAGRGVRLRPYTRKTAKALLLVDDEPLLVRNVRQLDENFDLDVIYVLIGHLGGQVRRALCQQYRARIEFIEVPPDQVSKGLLAGYAAISRFLEPGECFLSVLGDEFYGGGDHGRFREYLARRGDYAAVCAAKRFDQPDEYLRNYAVCLRDGSDQVERVVEKPASVVSPLYGLGLIASRRELADLARKELQARHSVNLIDLLNLLPACGAGPVYACEFQDMYVNINTRTDVYEALRQLRRRRQKDLAVDVIIPAWNEAESITYVVKDFLTVCRHVIVMDNRSPDGTAEIARQAGAVVYSEPLRGYGDAIKKGLDRSDADLLVVVEADGTFRAKDLAKLLPFAMDADAVIGSRTCWQYVEYGAYMPFTQRMGNLLFGLLITVLWWNRRSRFTDVGCSFRALWRDSYRKIADRLVGIGPEFAPEMVIELLNTWQRTIEVPVPYHARVLGASKFSAGFFRSARTALRMLKLILWKRAIGWGQNLRDLLSSSLAD